MTAVVIIKHVWINAFHRSAIQLWLTAAASCDDGLSGIFCVQLNSASQKNRTEL